MESFAGFNRIDLDAKNSMFSGQLPAALAMGQSFFDELWDQHPDDYHDIKIRNKVLKTPRWQQAYNRSYQYTGSRNLALPVPEIIKPHWDWTTQAIDERLNGLLLNWYDGKLGHYIGKHRDSTVNLIDGSPIVTISFGERRVFRMRPWKRKGFQDFSAENGSVFIIPFATNREWTHEVPASKKLLGRRISLTLRAFM